MPQKKYIINPMTGRKIQIGGRTYNNLIKTLETIDGILEEDYHQYGGAIGKTAKNSAKAAASFYSDLAKKSKTLNEPGVTVQGANSDGNINIPKSKYHLISSSLPPNPEQHSWYHHHAPFSQNFGDYVCLKKSTLRELGLFLRDSLLTDVKT